MSDREAISATLNSIEAGVGANELTAYQVFTSFTRMKRLLQAAQAPAQAVNQQLPEGYVLVPIEPTEAMIDMGVAVAFAASVHGKGGWNNYMKALYRAFIAAAQENNK